MFSYFAAQLDKCETHGYLVTELSPCGSCNTRGVNEVTTYIQDVKSDPIVAHGWFHKRGFIGKDSGYLLEMKDFD